MFPKPAKHLPELLPKLIKIIHKFSYQPSLYVPKKIFGRPANTMTGVDQEDKEDSDADIPVMF